MRNHPDLAFVPGQFPLQPLRALSPAAAMERFEAYEHAVHEYLSERHRGLFLFVNVFETDDTQLKATVRSLLSSPQRQQQQQSEEDRRGEGDGGGGGRKNLRAASYPDPSWG